MTQTTSLLDNTHLKTDVQSHSLPTNNRIKSLHRLIKVSKTYQRTPTRAISLFIILAISTYVIILNHDIYQHIGQLIRPNKLKCVYALGADTSREGLGAYIQRNQLSSFISSAFNLPLEFPPAASKHGYDLSDFFSKCIGDVQPKEIPLQCQMNFKSIQFERCPMGDCKCKARQMNEHMSSRRNECDVLGVWPDQLYNGEFSGCLRGMMMRYFGNYTKPKQEYNVVHYRAGDLEGDKTNPKTFNKAEIFFIIKALCYLNKLPIVVLTQGTPELPRCPGKRLILGSDLPLKETFKIAQHAKNLVLGESTFAFALMEVAKPERMIMLHRTVKYYEWVDCEKWTIIGPRGALFHFKSKKDMIMDVINRPTLQRVGLGYASENKLKSFRVSVPRRRWPKTDLFEKAIQVDRFPPQLPSTDNL